MNGNSIVTDALARYGATLSTDGLIQRKGKTLSVAVSVAKGRIKFMSTSGNLLASGPINAATVSSFVEKFWIWEAEK